MLDHQLKLGRKNLFADSLILFDGPTRNDSHVKDIKNEYLPEPLIKCEPIDCNSANKIAHEQK